MAGGRQQLGFAGTNAKSAAEEPYIVRFVVNSFSNEVASVDVLYAANAKKEPAVLNAPSPTGYPLAVTDSAIIIARFLDLTIRR